MHLSTIIRKNFLNLFISSISRLVANSLLFIIVGRFYGPATFGSFTSSYTMSLLFTYLADFGFDVLMTSEIAKDRENIDHIISRFLPIKILFASLAVILFLTTSIFIPTNFTTKIVLYIFSVNIILNTLLNMIFAIFKGYERFDYEAKIWFSTNILLLIFITVLSYYKMSIFFVAGSIIFCRFIGLTYALFQLKPYLKKGAIKLSFEFSKILTDLKFVSLFGLDLLFGALYLQIDTVLILSLKGEEQAGIYQSVFRLAMMVFIFPDLITNTIFPTVVRLYHQGNEAWKRLSEVALRFLYFASLPVAFILFIHAEDILTLIYGQKEFFKDINHLYYSTLILKITTATFILRFCAAPLAMVLTVKGKQNIRTAIVFVAAVMNISFNFWLIPIYGARGAIIISCLTNLFTFIAYLLSSHGVNWLLKKKIIIPFFLLAFFLVINPYLNSIVSISIQASLLIVYVIYGFYYLLSYEEKKLLLE
jgi:O-antigen/teichoic acid export membrane protein